MNNTAATYTKTSFDARNLLLLLYGEEYAIQLPLLPEEAAMEENLPNIAIQFKGQEEGNSANMLKVFPNPAQHEVQFVIPKSAKGALSLQVFNYIGQVVVTLNNIQSHQFIVNASTLPNGVYFYRLCVDDWVYEQGKVIVSH